MINEGSRTYFYLWTMAVIYIVLNLGVGLRILTFEASPIIITLVLFGFILFFGAKRYGWKTLLILFAITAVISWSMESLSIATGIPFGHYYYSDSLRPKLGAVPLIVMPAYFANGFLAWTLSHIFLDNLGNGIARRNRFLVPVFASFVMVMWDFCMDPVTSTIDGDWIWVNGGYYFGVPIQNYFGWFLTVFLIYQSFVLYLRWSGECGSPEDPRTNPLPKCYWYLAPVTFIGTAAITLAHPFAVKSHQEIYWSMFLAAVMTMVFVSLLAIVFVSRFEH